MKEETDKVKMLEEFCNSFSLREDGYITKLLVELCMDDLSKRKLCDMYQFIVK